ncbi:MAG TPA: hypothetical protein VF883_00780 [Thermoanaerobaculia bacterium]|jgi:hypothetical protein
MGQLVMSFRGIVCHVLEASGKLPDGVPHRVVVVNTSRGLKTNDYGDVPAHHCFLELDDETRKAVVKGSDGALASDELGHVPLRGWNVRVDNPLVGGPPVATELENLFHLRDYLPDMEPRVGIGNGVGDLPQWASCFVDIKGGNIALNTFPAGALYTTWTVETEGDPVLLFTPRNGSHARRFRVPIPSSPPEATLSDCVPGTIVLHNSTTDGTDKEFDFVLHFLLNQNGIPPLAGFARCFPIDDGGATDPFDHTPESDDVPLEAFVSMTTSCSNSTYP